MPKMRCRFVWLVCSLSVFAATAAIAEEPAVRRASQDEIRQFFAAQGKTVITFLGYSGAGYEDPDAMLRAAKSVLERHDPATSLVNIGVTPDGIGQVYPLAKSMGFTTTGIVSTQAQKYEASVSDSVDFGFYVEDETWGGFLHGSEELSPTSRAMVENSDIVVAIGGGEVARDELTAARGRGKQVSYVAADMNHQIAINKARKKGMPEPTDFRGAAHLVVVGSGE
jgi:hypothetical protein